MHEQRLQPLIISRPLIDKFVPERLAGGIFYTFKYKQFVKWQDSRIAKIIEIKVVKIGFANASAVGWPSHKTSELTQLIKYTLS